MTTQPLETRPEEQPENRSDRVGARHPLSIGHLVMGVAFAGLTAVWALIAGGVVDGEHVRFLLPGPWVLAGAAGLLALILTDRRRHGTRATGWIGLEDPPPADPPEADDESHRPA